MKDLVCQIIQSETELTKYQLYETPMAYQIIQSEKELTK